MCNDKKVYKCLKSDFEKLEKKIKHITKKLDKNGLKWNFEVIGESVEEIKVFDYRGMQDIPAAQRYAPKPKTLAVETIHYTFEMERLQLGDFEVIAVIEHFKPENLIHIIKENSIVPLKYRTAKSVCEHCNSNRQRNKTVLLQDTNGNIKQVGTSCIKEYTGIDGVSVISAYMELQNISVKEINIDFNRARSLPKLDKTIDYLTACIQLIKTIGYVKSDDNNCTKDKAGEIAGTEKQDNKYNQLAQDTLNYFLTHVFSESETFLNNIKVLLSQNYTKPNGLIAYAYLAYEKQLEIETKKKAEQQNKKESNYIGTVGEKIETELKLKKYFCYESFYGVQKIYLFEDVQGNLYKWNSTNSIGIEEGEQIKLKGTIKAHEEYKQEKQTVLTRCKVNK